MRHSMHKFVLCLFTVLFLAGANAAWAGEGVAFSGKVKKVIAAKNKVAIKDPETKKRFTVIVDDKTQMSGWKGIEDIKKGDAIEGKYVVTEKGLYIAVELKGK